MIAEYTSAVWYRSSSNSSPDHHFLFSFSCCRGYWYFVVLLKDLKFKPCLSNFRQEPNLLFIQEVWLGDDNYLLVAFQGHADFYGLNCQILPLEIWLEACWPNGRWRCKIKIISMPRAIHIIPYSILQSPVYSSLNPPYSFQRIIPTKLDPHVCNPGSLENVS